LRWDIPYENPVIPQSLETHLKKSEIAPIDRGTYAISYEKRLEVLDVCRNREGSLRNVWKENSSSRGDGGLGVKMLESENRP
jgi:hypothetical protein